MSKQSFDRWWQELKHELYILEGFHTEEVAYIDWWLHFNNGLSVSQAIRKEFG